MHVNKAPSLMKWHIISPKDTFSNVYPPPPKKKKKKKQQKTNKKTATKNKQQNKKKKKIEKNHEITHISLSIIYFDFQHSSATS